jgi:cysteinyl-tRNA synthetase
LLQRLLRVAADSADQFWANCSEEIPRCSSCKGGLLWSAEQRWRKPIDRSSAVEIEALIEARLAARKAKDFNLSDAIRDELKAAGILLEDAAGGTQWRRE